MKVVIKSIQWFKCFANPQMRRFQQRLLTINSTKIFKYVVNNSQLQPLSLAPYL